MEMTSIGAAFGVNYECKDDMIFKDSVMNIEQEYCYGTISKSINPTMKFALTLQVAT